MITAIERSKLQPAHCVLIGIGVPCIGKTTAKKLMAACPSLLELSVKSKQWFVALPDIGDLIASQIVRFFEERGRQLVLELQDVGLSVIEQQNVTLSDTTNYVITGTIHGMSRREISKMLAYKCNGVLQSSVTSSTDMLLVGDEGGEGTTKYKKAVKLGIPIAPAREILNLNK